MALGFGYNAWAGMAAEGTYGTPAGTITDFVEINSETMVQADDVMEGNSVYRSEKDVDNYKQGRKTVAGNITMDLRYEGAEKYFEQAMGTVTSAAINGTLAYTHTYSLADALLTGFTLEIDRDVANYVYEGCKINTMTLSNDNAGILQASFDLIAEDEGTMSATSPNFSTSNYFSFDEAALAYAGTAQPIQNVSLVLNNNLTTDRFQWGSRLLKEPQRAGRIEVSGEFTVEFDSTENWDDFINAGTGSLSVTYTGDTISGTSKYGLLVTLPHVRLIGGTPNVSDSGMLTATVPFTAYADGTAVTSRLMQIAWTNTQASV